MHREYAHIRYPEDVKEKKEYRKFKDEFEKFSPVRRPDPAEDYEDETGILAADI